MAPADKLKDSKSLIMTKAVHLSNPHVGSYPIKNTGYYCILTDSFSGHDYEAVAVFRNAFGELPATQIPKLPFYGGMSIVYAVVAMYVSSADNCGRIAH